MSKENLPPEALEQLKQMRSALPKMKRDCEDIRRLVKLARQSPYASANIDFIDRVEMQWREREGQTELTDIIVGIMDKHE